MRPRTQYHHPKTGRRLPSVTTILSRFKDSGGLIHWANAQGLEGVTLEEARNAPATAGTLAHAMVEAHLHREPAASALEGHDGPIADQARQAFENFLKWKEQSKLRFLHTEVALVSAARNFGGRLDAVGVEPDGRMSIVDFKTGPLYADHLLQVAAYKALWEESYPDKPILGGAHLLSFRRESADFGHHYFADLAEEEKTFFAMRDLYDRVKRIERRAK